MRKDNIIQYLIIFNVLKIEKTSALVKYFILLFFSILFVFQINAQEEALKSRILFIVDYSGSMHVMWGNEKKYETARRVLFDIVDSIQKVNPKVEIGVRIFGHLSDRTKNDCKDSKLEIPFGLNNAQQIKTKFNQIVAQGQTPIAYSLLEAAKDFPDDKDVVNSIILITDGLESCNGNPCEASLELKKKRVTINPYIIGLDIESELIKEFECIGTFVNAKDEQTYKKVLDMAVKTSINKTSVEINLLSQKKELISNTPITLYNHYTGEVIYNFIHSLDKAGKADTIYLDPRGVFDIEIHTFPSLKVKKVELKSGIHNVINVSVLKGQLDFHYEKAYDDKKLDYVIRPIGSKNIIFNRAIDDEYFLSNQYDLSIFTFPITHEKSKNIPIERSVHQYIKINGKLVIDVKTSILASLYIEKNGKYELLIDFGWLKSRTEQKLQPGKYKLVTVDYLSKQSETTIVRNFEILESKTVLIN